MPPRCSTIQWRLIVSSIRRRPRRLIPINRAAVTATIPPTMTVARTFNLFGAGPVDNQGRWWLTPGAACRNEGTRVMPAPDIVGRPVLLWRLEHASHPPTECVSLVLRDGRYHVRVLRDGADPVSDTLPDAAAGVRWALELERELIRQRWVKPRQT